MATWSWTNNKSKRALIDGQPTVAMVVVNSCVATGITAIAQYFYLQRMTELSGGMYVRPLGIVYIIPVAIMAAYAGYGAGFLTLALCLATAIPVLIPRDYPLPFTLPTGIAEIVGIAIIGCVVTVGLEALRRNERFKSRARAADQVALETRLRADTDREKALDAQRQFLKNMLLTTTEHRLHLCFSKAELPALPEDAAGYIDLTDQSGLSKLRHEIEETSEKHNFSRERRYDLQSASGEAAMNSIVHGRAGQAKVYGDDSRIVVVVRDRGIGIDLERLPRATLEKGYSTAGSLGFGFKMMLRCADRIWLMTGPSGTTVVIEQDRVAPPDEISMLVQVEPD